MIVTLSNLSFPLSSVISAGVIANLLIAWLVLCSQATFIGLPSQPSPGVLVIDVQKEQPAEISGLKAGDQIVSIEGVSLGTGQGAVEDLVNKIQKSPGKVISIQKISNGVKEIIT